MKHPYQILNFGKLGGPGPSPVGELRSSVFGSRGPKDRLRRPAHSYPGVLAAVGLLALLTACGGNPAPGGNPAAGGPAGGMGGRGMNRQAVVTVKAEPARFGPLTAEIDTTGVLAAKTQSQVAAQLSGVVAGVYRQAGDYVKAGDVVVQLDTAQLSLTLRTAQTNLKNATINYDTAKLNNDNASPRLQLQVQTAESALAAAQKNAASAEALFKLGGISGSDLDNARAQVQQAQANLEGAKIALDQNKNAGSQNLAQLALAVDLADLQVQQASLNLRNASVKAPFAGQLAAVNVKAGEYVSANTAVFVLVSPETVINFSVAPTDAMTLTSGTPVTFLLDGTGYPTRITQTPSAPIGGLVPLTAAFPAGLKAPLGSVGTLRYSVTRAQGILVGVSSLQSNENKTFVFIEKDGKAATRDVTVLAEAGAQAAVSGLEPGVRVVVSPPPGLLPGATLQVLGDPPVSGTSEVQNSGSKPNPSQGNSGAPGTEGKRNWSGNNGPREAGTPGQNRPSRPEGTSGAPGRQP